jgi:hypothetical protein
MILCHCCLHSFVTESYKHGILNATCKSRVGMRSELSSADTAISKGIPPPRIAMRGRHKSL